MTKAANELRGEVSLELEGDSYVLRPSYEAILEVERLTGSTIVPLAQSGLAFTLSMSDAAIVVTEFIKAHGRSLGDEGKALANVNAKRIGEMIYDAGLPKVSATLGAVLAGAANGAYTAAGEAKPGTGKTTTAPSTGV